MTPLELKKEKLKRIIDHISEIDFVEYEHKSAPAKDGAVNGDIETFSLYIEWSGLISVKEKIVSRKEQIYDYDEGEFYDRE